MSRTLPPLPPIGGETTGRSVVDVVGEQHRQLLDLCARLTAGDRTGDAAGRPVGDRTGDASGRPGGDHAGDRRRVAQVVSATLSRHLSGEQQYLYPAVRAVVPDGDVLADRELAEDRALLVTLRHLDATGPDDPAFGRLAADVAAAVRRHVAVAADETMPLLTRMAPVEDLIRLGNRLETAEEAAPTRPHPDTPSTPPWNKVVDPLVGVADKARDAVSRRVTRADDL